MTLSLSHWYPGPGVVFDCIVSLSLPSCTKELSQCQAKGTTGFIQAGLSKNQGLLKDSPTVFKDNKFI